MTNKTLSTLSKVTIGLMLQDAYWYADRAAGNKECFDDITRGEALKRCILACRAAGLRLSTTLFPRTVGNAQAMQGAIERWGMEQGVDARTGEVLAALVVGTEAIDAISGRVVRIDAIVEGRAFVTRFSKDRSPLGDTEVVIPTRELRPLGKAELDGQTVNAARGALPTLAELQA